MSMHECARCCLEGERTCWREIHVYTQSVLQKYILRSMATQIGTCWPFRGAHLCVRTVYTQVYHSNTHETVDYTYISWRTCDERTSEKSTLTCKCGDYSDMWEADLRDDNWYIGTYVRCKTSVLTCTCDEQTSEINILTCEEQTHMRGADLRDDFRLIDLYVRCETSVHVMGWPQRLIQDMWGVHRHIGRGPQRRRQADRHVRSLRLHLWMSDIQYVLMRHVTCRTLIGKWLCVDRSLLIRHFA